MIKCEQDASGQSVIRVDVDEATIIRIPVERINTIKKFQVWVRREEMSGWLTSEILDELWHFCAVAFEWP